MQEASADKWYAKIGNALEIENPRARRFYRAMEMLPGILSWGTIFGMLILSYYVPVFIAIFIIIFDVYWFSKSVLFSIHLISSYREIKKRIRKNWLKKVEKKYGDVYKEYRHLIILPTFNEPYELIQKTFEAIVKSNYPLDTFIVALATEEA
ncbi:hypothetical protein ACFL3C_02745, partial [Patescibacteria group bacterium]